MKHTLQATIKTKDGIRTFSLSLQNLNPRTKETLERFFKKSDHIKIEELLYFCISQTEENSQYLEKIAILQTDNQELREQQEDLHEELEKLYHKLETL